MAGQKESKVSQLIHKGVRIDCPDSIEIGEEVDVGKISGQGVVIHAGSKIFGHANFKRRPNRI
jgi:UDP-N-acetylglucosamine/UDP-N-acetylgalactosamine diphosphorylase